MYAICFIAICFIPFLKGRSLSVQIWENLNFKKKFCIFVSVVFILLLFLKHDYVGTDTQNYRFMYNLILNRGLDYRYTSADTEIGFLWLNLLFSRIGIPFRLMLLCCYIFYISVVSVIVNRYSKNPLFSYFLFFSYGFFVFATTLRQCIALSFTILAYILIEKNKKILPLIAICVAVLFHKSAIIFFSYYLLENLKWNKFTKGCVAVGFVIVVLFYKQIVQFFLSLLNENQYLYDSMTGGWGTIIMYALLVVLGFWKYRDYAQANNAANSNLLLFMAIALLVLPLGRFSPFFFRIAEYFQIYMILFLPNLLSSLKDKYLKYLILLFAITYGIFQISIKTDVSGIRLFPYVFFWEEYPVKLSGLYPSGGW